MSDRVSERRKEVGGNWLEKGKSRIKFGPNHLYFMTFHANLGVLPSFLSPTLILPERILVDRRISLKQVPGRIWKYNMPVFLFHMIVWL